MRRLALLLLGTLAMTAAAQPPADAPQASPSPQPPALPAPPVGMVKFASIWEQPGDPVALDRWYRTTHSREAMLFVGPWLRRYWAYRGYDAPHEADVVGVSRYRLTEMWYGSLAERDEANRAWYPLSAPPSTIADPKRTRISQIYVPGIPDEKYVDGWPRERPDYLRWTFLIRYPEGVDPAAGEQWFRASFAPALAKAPGVRRFTCSRAIDPPRGASSWVRMCEMWFDDYTAWKAAILDAPHPAAPPWKAAFPYVTMISIFTNQNPDFDFMRDGYHAP